MKANQYVCTLDYDDFDEVYDDCVFDHSYEDEHDCEYSSNVPCKEACKYWVDISEVR